MKTSIRVGLVGAGMAGQAHAFGYRNAMMAPDLADLNVELVTIVDPNLALAQTVANRYGFASVTGDLDQLLQDEDIDVVSVALPNFLHVSVLTRVLASGKHAFAEKPIGRTVEEALDLTRKAHESNAVTGVGFSFRRLPPLAAVAEAVAAGEVGRPHTVRGWYYADYAADPSGALSWRYSQEQSGGGALLDIGSHAIDAVQYVAGPITRVLSADLRTVITSRPLSVDGAIGHGGSTSTETGHVTNDDTALLTVEFANGAHGQITLSRIARGIPNSLGVEVFGTGGHARFDSIRAGEFQLFNEDTTTPAHNGRRTVFTGPEHPYFTDVAAMPGGGVGTGYGEAFVAEIQQFLRCVRDGREMDTNFDTALSMMNVVGAALKAAEDGQVTTVQSPAATRIAS
jgi:predicted dehydrogenase